jgi:hypothetical protein
MKQTTRIASQGAIIVMIALLAACPLGSSYQLPPEKPDPRIIGTWRTQEDDFNGLKDIEVKPRDANSVWVKDLNFDWDYYDEYAEYDDLENYDGTPAETYIGTFATVGSRKYIIVRGYEPYSYADDYFYLAYEFSPKGLILISTDDSYNPNSGLVIDNVQELKEYILKAQENPKFFTNKPSNWVKDK